MPELCPQAVTNSLVISRLLARSVSLAGRVSIEVNLSITALSPHLTPSLRPTPRGSKLTRSKRLFRVAKALAAWAMVSTPEAPGPPKLKTSEPIRLPGFVALTRMTAISMDSPSGLA